jgi:hypothetical protein
LWHISCLKGYSANRIIFLPPADMNEHPSAVNVFGLEGADLGDSQTGSIGNGQDGFVLGRFNRGEEGENFLHGEDFWKGLGSLG